MNFGPDFRKLFRYFKVLLREWASLDNKKKKNRKIFGLISIGSDVMKKNNPGICGPSASINRQSFASVFDFFKVYKYYFAIYIHFLVNPSFILHFEIIIN